MDNTVAGTEESVFDGVSYKLFNNRDKSYIKYNAGSMEVDKSKIHAKDRYFKNPDGQPAVYLRPDPSYMRASKEMLFPQQEAIGFLEDYNTWNIVGNERYLDFNAVVVEGSFNKYYAEKFTAPKFKFWVEPSTGILLKDEWYDSSGNTIQDKQITSLKLNTNIDDNNFKKDEQGYTLRQIGHNSGPVETGTIGAKNDINEVNAAIKAIEKKYPFYHGFTSADLRTFQIEDRTIGKGYYILTYYFPKKTTGNDANVIFVRQYQNGTTTKEDNDFLYDSGQKLSAFDMNGILWVEYKSTGGKTSYFMGTKDNIIFEVSSQVYSPDQIKGYLKTFSSL